MKRNRRLILVFSLVMVCMSALDANAAPATFGNATDVGSDVEIEILPTLATGRRSPWITTTRIRSLVHENLDVSAFRQTRVQMIEKTKGVPAHLIVHLHAKTTHRVDFVSIWLADDLKALAVEKNYKLTGTDQAQIPGKLETAQCPDTGTQFISFAPNPIDFEVQIARDVATVAKQKGFQTAELYVANATRQNYFNYMACPNLKGDFYDGDSNPELIVTADGTISAQELAAFRFNHHVTHIWLACQAFNDPLLTTMIHTTQSQKYAAGVNDLQIGPSDNAGKCAMIAALNGQPMTASFQACYKQYDTPSDHWGFDGEGSDLFGQ